MTPGFPDAKLAALSGVREQLADKLRAILEYAALFRAACPEIPSRDSSCVHAANAIAAFEATAWRFDDSPYDRCLRGDKQSLSPPAKRGLRVFYASGKTPAHRKRAVAKT
jgi:cytochrome c peroxidase